MSRFERTGQWPVLIPVDTRFSSPEARRVLVDWVLADWAVPHPREAEPPRYETDPLADAANTGSVLTGAGGRHGLHRLGLAEVDDPADIPGLLGWGPGGAGAVLRSWQSRFGARLVVLGTQTMVLSVARPPTTMAQAERVAAEHKVFKSETANKRSYASSLVRARRWRLRYA
ncbi:DUF4253 domain-containing protein [Labedaea rhizosphaerae]|uniref:DUF4253 domain-containing protein n=1 Tax=Labedaea rhizosphaerae TaxID=598644 RepID=UPI001FB7F437|nr:DUF4253 domain-containing protein [Labedaea rhizosphaerae]